MAELGELLQPVNTPAEARSASVAPDFLQGRTAFGGLMGALCVRAMASVLEAKRPLRSLIVSLVGPVSPGEIEIEAESIREGKAASHARATILQGGSIRVVALGAFGTTRESSLVVKPPPAPVVPTPDALWAAPFISGLTPEFSKFFEYRWPPETTPFSGQGEGVMQGWLRLRAPIAATEPFLVALGDSWPSPALAMLSRPAAFSTLTWSLELTGAPIDQCADAWWMASAKVEQASDGYVRQETRYFDQAGALVMVSRQVVTVFA